MGRLLLQEGVSVGLAHMRFSTRTDFSQVWDGMMECFGDCFLGLFVIFMTSVATELCLVLCSEVFETYEPQMLAAACSAMQLLGGLSILS